MLLQKHFKLVPNQDNNLEELINELALSKKNIKEIREYGTKLKKYNDSTYKGYNNSIEDNETYNNLNINKDNVIYENDNNLIYKEDNITYKKNIINNNFQLRTRNGSISNVLLNKKRRKEKIKEQTNASKKEDNDYNLGNYNDKNINKNEYSKSPIHKDNSEYNLFCSSNVLNLSNFKDNALFQRIYKSIEEEKMNSKYEKIKNKKEEWKKKKLKNEHIRNENIRNEHIINENIRNEKIRNDHIRNERIINEKIKNENIIYERLHNKNSNKISNKIIQVEELLKDEKKKKNEILKAKRKCSYNKTFKSFSSDVNTSEYSDNISFNKKNNNNYMKHKFINYNEDGKRKIYIYYNDMNKKEKKKIQNVDNNIKPLYHIWNKKNYTTECDNIKKKKKKECNKKGKDVQYNFVMEKRDQIENCKKQIKNNNNNNNNINENFVKSYNNKRKHKKKCKRMTDICDVKSNDENIIDYKKMFTTFKNLKHIKKKNIIRKEKEDICDNIISKYNNTSEQHLNITTSNESVKSLKSNSSYIFKYKNSYIPNSLLIKNQINNIKENKKNKSMNPSLKQNTLCKSNDINLYVHKYQYLVLKKRKRKFMHLKSIIQQKGDRHKCIHMFKKWIHQNNVRLSNNIINDHFDNNIKDNISDKFPSKLNKNEANWIINNDIYMNSTECSDKREDTILTSHIISSNDNNGYIPVEEILNEHANTNREEDTHIDIINNKEENISSNSIIKEKIHSSHTNNMDTNMLNKDISINILNSVENIEDINNMSKSFNLSCLKMNNENNNNSNDDNTNMLLCKNIDIEEQNNTQKDNSKSESDISYTLYSQQGEKKDGTHSNNYTSNCLNSCYTDLENMNIPCSNNDKIFKDVLSFYNMYKDKVKFLLLEECNYLKSLRNMMEEGSKNISENFNNNISKNDYYSNNIFEKNQNLFDELLKTLKSNKMSENSRYNNLFDMNRNSENEKNMKKNIIESNKNDVINFYKDPINFLLICNQTEKRIKEIERILNINDNDSNSSKVNIINDEYNMRKTNNIFEKKEMNCNKNENEQKLYEENNFICNNNDDFINIINPSQYNKNKIEETNFTNKNPFLSVFNFNSLILANTIRDLQKENNDSVKRKKKTNKYIKARKNKYFKSSHLYTMYIQNNVDYLYKRKRKTSIYYIINLKSVDMMCQNVDIIYIVLNNIRRKNFKYSFPIIKRNYYIKRYFNYNPKINPKGKKYIFLFKYNKFFYKISENKKKDIDLIGMKYKCTPESILIPISDKDNFLNSKVSNNKLKYVHTSINHSKDLPNKEEKNMLYFPSIDNIKEEENIDITYENTKNVLLYSQEVDKNIHIHVHNNNDIHLNNNCEYMKSNVLEKNHFDLLTSNILNNNLKYQEENDNNPLRKNKLHHSYNSIKSLDIKNDIKFEENNNVTRIKEMKINYNKPCIVHVQKNDMSKQKEDNKINMEKKNILSNNKEYITNSIKYEISNNYYNNNINNENDRYHKNNNIHSLNIDNTCDDYSSLHLQKDKKNNRIELNGNKKKKEYFFNLYESNYNPFHSRDKITSMNKLNNSYDNIVNTLCNSVGGGENFHLSNNKNYMFNKNKSNSIIRTSEHINSYSQRNKDKSKIINEKNSNENFTENDMIHSLNVQEKASQYDHTNILENKNFDNINKLRNKRNIAYKKKDDLFFNNDTNKNIITSMSERDYLNVTFEEAKKEDNLINNKKLQNNNFNSNSIQKCVMKNMNEDNLFLYNNNNNKSSHLNIDSKFLYSNNIIQNEYNLDNYNFIKKEAKYNYSNVKPVRNTLINNNINNKSKVFIKEEDILGKNKKEKFKLGESNKNSFYFSNENMNSNILLNVEPNKDYNIKALSYNINRNINEKKLNESQRYDSSFIINKEESNFIDNKNIHHNENWECNYKDELKTNFGNTLKNNNEHMSNYYINSILSHSFNIYENKSIYEDDYFQNSLSSSIMDTDKLDEVIQKIRTFKTMNERNNNYISCLYCDKYLFKLDNYHEDFFFVCSNKEEIRKEKYTCSICKHKLRVLNKYKNDNVQKYIHIKSNDTIEENSTNRIIKNMDNNIKVKRDTMNDICNEDDYIKHYNGHDNNNINYINYSNNNNYNDNYRNYEENHSDYTKDDDNINQSNMFYLNKDFQDGFSYNVDKKDSLYSRKKNFCDFKGLNNFDTKNLYSEFCNVPKESNISSSYTSYKSNITDQKNELRNSKNSNNNYPNDIYNICNNKSNNDMNTIFNNIHKNYKSYSDDEINKLYNKNDDMIKIDKRFSLDMRLLKLRRKNHENNIIQKGLLHNNNNNKNKKNNNKNNSLYHNNSSSLIIDGMTNVNRTNMNTYEKEKSIYNINLKEMNENKNKPCESNFLNRTIENTSKCYNYMNYYISEDNNNNNNNNNNNFEYQIEKNYILNEDKYKGINNEQVTNLNLENIHLKEKKKIKEMRTSNNDNYPFINHKHNFFKSLLINGDKNMLNISNDEDNCFKKYYSTYIN